MDTHGTSQLRENWSHHFCAAKQLSVGAAEQLSVGAGWAGMVWADVLMCSGFFCTQKE